jgi:ribonuclease P protein component
MDIARAWRPRAAARLSPPGARAAASGSAPDFFRPAGLTMQRLRQRADFLAAAGASKVPTAGFVLQARSRGDVGPVRVGFTVSRKVGTAVERNRVRRRLREIVRLAGADLNLGHDYVLVGRRSALSRTFDRMVDDLRDAARRLNPTGGETGG